jgi:hypothetical protein
MDRATLNRLAAKQRRENGRVRRTAKVRTSVNGPTYRAAIPKQATKKKRVAPKGAELPVPSWEADIVSGRTGRQ